MNERGIGFIGTGIMGEPMALHLVQAGYRVRAWNRTLTKLEALSAAGAEACAEARSATRDVFAVICMLSDGPACDAVFFGEGAAAAAMAPGSTLVVMSSIPVETAIEQARKCAALGVHYIDAPVSGGQRGAREANLAIMAGGAEADFVRVREILAVMGRPVQVGPVGCGQLAKIANQMIVASTIATVSEALVLAERGGANPARVREALAGGFADSPILRQHGQRMIAGDFKPGGPAKWQLKDTHTAVALAKSLGLSLPVIGLVDSLFQDLIAHGDGDLDHSALIREIRRRNNLAVAQ